MNILHLATQDISGGGGGFDASYRLHCNMRSQGIDSFMLVLNKESADSDVFEVSSHFSFYNKFMQYVCSILRRGVKKIFRISQYINIDCLDVVRAPLLLKIFPTQPDIIIVHWVSRFIDASTLHELNRMTGVPIIWYLMDMAAFTGGCHYAFDCTGYISQCGNCPQLGVLGAPNDISNRQWKKKKTCFQETNITIVSGSTWLKNQVESGSVFFNKKNETILLGINTDIFSPANQKEARKQLGLQTNRKIIFFGAQNIHEERKGIRYLVGALNLLYSMLGNNTTLRDQIIVVTAGRDKTTEELDIAFEHHHIGFLNGDVMLATGYQAADVFVNASIEDAGPMMINESILCGTPVVSFEMGVAVDLVHNDKTGYRARLKDERDMAVGLHRILEMNNEAYSAMRTSCRDYGLKLCHPNVQVSAFVTLCNELINDNKDHS